MQGLTVRRIAGFLKLLVNVTFVCNLIAVPAVPYVVWQGLGEAGSGWQGAYHGVLVAFLMACGVCTAVILWQGRRVLNAILQGQPFSMDNAVSLRRAAVCAFCIAAAALARMCWGFWFYRSLRPLATYNALFVPIFFMAGLLCLIMSALFRQAAELKAENDLTI